MCGIAGILEFDKEREPTLEELRRMAQVLKHRGPDEEGFYQSRPVGLAHRRLSIIDLVSGQQPMESPDGRLCVVFNGEVYNFPELKLELEGKGYTFRTRSDTEVLLALYSRYGLEAFPKINGMFACAFWDRAERQLVLARDRFGKKPLFYYHGARRFLFASEIKALLTLEEIERKINPAALHEYLTYTYVVGDQTFIQGIYRLPPAHVLVIRDGQQQLLRPYWELKFEPDSNPATEPEVLERVGDLLRRAVKSRLISDVPLGAFLSGGLDSSTVVALMTQLSDRPVRTFTIGFDESRYSELEDARVVAKHLGTDHHEIIVKPSAFDVLPELVWHFDEPFGDSSALPTYYVCKAAREHVTVALSGDGGDEVFAGYNRYRRTGRSRRFQKIPIWMRHKMIRPLANTLPFTFPAWNSLYAMGRVNGEGTPFRMGIYPYIQEQIYSDDLKMQLKGCSAFAAEVRLRSKAQHLDPVSRSQYRDTLEYLPADILTKVDRMSMANSLEVRSPFLDYTLVEYMATLPVSFKLREGTSKYILRKLCSQMLPASVLSKPKQGFAIPRDQWFQKELRPAAEEILLDARTVARGYFRNDILKRVLRHHATGKRDYSTWIWCLVVLEMWQRLFLDSRPGLQQTSSRSAS